MSVVACADYFFPRIATIGASPEASAIEVKLASRAQMILETGALAPLRDCLFSAFAEAQREVKLDVLSAGLNFALALPKGIEPPQITVESDGEVSFDWVDDANNLLSVSIGATGRLTYAADVEDRPVSGSAQFAGGIPSQIFAALQSFKRQ